MRLERVKVGSTKKTEKRVNPKTGKEETYTVLVDLYEEVWVEPGEDKKNRKK